MTAIDVLRSLIGRFPRCARCGARATAMAVDGAGRDVAPCCDSCGLGRLHGRCGVALASRREEEARWLPAQWGRRPLDIALCTHRRADCEREHAVRDWAEEAEALPRGRDG